MGGFISARRGAFNPYEGVVAGSTKVIKEAKCTSTIKQGEDGIGTSTKEENVAQLSNPEREVGCPQTVPQDGTHSWSAAYDRFVRVVISWIPSGNPCLACPPPVPPPVPARYRNERCHTHYIPGISKFPSPEQTCNPGATSEVELKTSNAQIPIGELRASEANAELVLRRPGSVCEDCSLGPRALDAVQQEAGLATDDDFPEASR